MTAIGIAPAMYGTFEALRHIHKIQPETTMPTAAITIVSCDVSSKVAHLVMLSTFLAF